MGEVVAYLLREFHSTTKSTRLEDPFPSSSEPFHASISSFHFLRMDFVCCEKFHGLLQYSVLLKTNPRLQDISGLCHLVLAF